MRPTSPLRTADFLSLDDDVAIEIAESEASVMQNVYKVRRKLVRRRGTLPLGSAALSPDQDLNLVQWGKLGTEELLAGVFNTSVVDFFALSPGATILNGAARFTNNDCNAAWINQKLFIGDGYSQNCYIDLEAGLAANFAAASSQYLSHASNSSLQLTGGSFTIAFWAYLNTVAGNGTFVAKSAGGVSTTEFEVGLGSSNITFTVGNAGGLGPSAITWGGGLPITLSTGQWYFFVAWYDASANTINIQGNNGAISSATPVAALLAPSTNDFALGARSDAAHFLNGRMESPGVWKRALTSAERTTLYNAGVALFSAQVAGTSLTTNLSGWWDCEEASGTRADASGNGNNLTDHNTVTTAAGVGGLVPKVQQAMVGAPAAACTAAAGGAGSGTGNFTFVYCYLAANGALSEPSPVSNQVTLTAQKADLTGVTVSSEDGVTARYIYATGGTRTDYVLVDILANNTATTVTVNLDGIINPLSPLIFGNTRFPPCRYLIEHQSRMVGAWCNTAEGDKQTVFVSNLLAPWYAPAAPDLDIAANGTQAQLQGPAAGEIAGLCGHGDFVAVFTGGAGFFLIGTEAADFRLQQFCNHGCTAHRTIQSTRHLLIWLSSDGVYSYNGTATERISDLVRETIAAMTATDMAKAHSFVWYDRYFLAWPGHCIYFDLLTRTWGTHTQWDWRSSTVTTFVSGAQQRIYAAQTGHARVWQLETGATDNGVAIPVVWQSRDFEMGLPTHEKRVHLIEAKFKKSTGTVTVRLYRGTGDLIQTETQDLASVDFTDSDVVRMLRSANEMARDENFRLRIEYSGTAADFQALAAGLQWTPAL